MDLKNLVTFKTILETGSFLAAARRLNCSQSTITFQIQQLEERLSVPLFEKIGRRTVPTQSGRDLLPYVNDVLSAVDRLENFGRSCTELTGALTVDAAETLLTYRLPPVLKLFRELAPCVGLSVQCRNCCAVRGDLISGAADLGVHYDVGGYGNSIVVEKISEFPLVLIASPHVCSTELGADGHISLVTTDPDGIYQRMLEDYLRENNIAADAVMNLGSVEAVKACVSTDIGAAVLPRYTVEQELSDGRLVELESGFSGRTVACVCTYHKNKCITPAMELFIRLTKEQMGAAAC